MDAIERDHTQMHSLVEEMRSLIGTPAQGSTPATGLHSLIGAVSGRLAWFEKLREQAKGAGYALAIGIPTTGALIWFLAGDRITALFHG